MITTLTATARTTCYYCCSYCSYYSYYSYSYSYSYCYYNYNYNYYYYYYSCCCCCCYYYYYDYDYDYDDDDYDYDDYYYDDYYYYYYYLHCCIVATLHALHFFLLAQEDGLHSWSHDCWWALLQAFLHKVFHCTSHVHAWSRQRLFLFGPLDLDRSYSPKVDMLTQLECDLPKNHWTAGLGSWQPVRIGIHGSKNVLLPIQRAACHWAKGKLQEQLQLTTTTCEEQLTKLIDCNLLAWKDLGPAGDKLKLQVCSCTAKSKTIKT